MDKAEKAKQILRHYFRLIAKNAGSYWDGDNESEIEEVVDLIIGAATDKARDILGQRQGDKGGQG